MAPTKLSVRAKENGTYLITAVLRDEDGNLAVPESLSWTLTDEAGVVVNGRLDVAITPPSGTVEILLSGDDLHTPGYKDAARILTIKGQYNSSRGLLPLVEDVRFVVENVLYFSGLSPSLPGPGADTGIPEPTSDGLWARLRASGVGSWLAATSVGAALFAAVDAAAARGAIGAVSSDDLGSAAYEDANSNGTVPATVVKRTTDGGINVIGNQFAGVAAFSTSGPGIEAASSTGQSTAVFKDGILARSTINRELGHLTFVGSAAAAGRSALLKELVQSLPTADPGIAGEPWLNNGVLTFSQG